MTESEFIEALRTLPLHAGANGLRDDCATLDIGGERLVLTHDAIAEGVHYKAGTDPADIAWKLVAVNLSDLAAKGAEPVGVLIGATLPENGQRFVEGLREVLHAYSVPLLGGDTISTRPAVYGCTAIGRTKHAPQRTGARPGDLLWVTGEIGAAYRDFATDGPAYLRPQPRLSDGMALAPIVTAMMDVSDGLFLDARRMAEASNCSVEITLDAIPYAQGVTDRMAAATWGDDYQLLFAAGPDFVPPVAATKIGIFLAKCEHTLLIDGIPAPSNIGYEHR